MVRFLKLLLLVPVALVVLAFAIANRHLVTVSFDPFSGTDIDGPQITAPLFILLFLATMCGVLIGGLATWLTNGKSRRAARLARAEADRLRGETERLRAQIAPSADRSGALLRQS
jgi:hypothetical protein